MTILCHMICDISSSGRDAGHAIHEALAVIIAKLQYQKRKLSASSTTFLLRIHCLRNFKNFPTHISKCEGSLFVLHQFEGCKYLCKDHSMEQTVV